MIELTSVNAGDYKRGLYPAVVRKALRTNGFENAGTVRGEEQWKHNKHPDISVSFNGRRENVEHEKLMEIADALKKIEERKNGKLNNSKNSLPDWLHLSKDYSGEMNGNELVVRSNEFPELALRMTFKDSDNNRKATFVRAFESYQEKLKGYSESVSELKNYFGVEFKRENGELIITQKDYGIDKHFSFTNREINIAEELSAIKKEVDNKCFEWAEKLDELPRNGFILHKPVAANNVSGYVTQKITHPELKEPIYIKLHGELERVDGDGMREITKALTALDKPKDKSIEAQLINGPKESSSTTELTTTILPKRTMVDYISSKKPELPDEKKASLIFDASTLILQNSARGNGRTWLDILPLTADLPTVDKIYIPAIVADWELRGGIACEGQNGKLEFKKINNNTPNRPAINELLSTASRWRLDEHGKGHLIEGRNPNIVIYETSIDREFSEGVNKIYNDRYIAKENKGKYYEKLTQKLRNNNNMKPGIDLGEFSMQSVAQELKGPAFLITNDITFLRARDQITTKHGFPVGEATLVGFIKGEISARGEEIKKLMEEHYGVPVGDLTVERFKQNVVDAGHFDGNIYPNGYPDCVVGKHVINQELSYGETIESLFKRGVEIVHEKETPRIIIPLTDIKRSSSILEQPQLTSEKLQQEISAPPPVDNSQPTEIQKDKGNTMDTSGKSFGYKIGFHQMQRDMNDHDFATAIKNIVQNEPDVNIDRKTVFKWQTNQELPKENIYNSLVQVLIDDNNKVEDKAKAKAEFRDAYERTKKAIEQAATSDKNDTFAFINALDKYREQADLLDNDKLAEKLLKQVKFGADEKPEQIDKMLIFKMSQGEHTPSLGLLRATIKALDDNKPLSDQEKREIFDAYALVKPKATSLIKSNSSTKLSPQSQTVTAGLKDITALKKKMRALYVNRDGEEIQGSQISIATGISNPEISMILGKGDSIPENKTKEALLEQGYKLADKLGKLTRDPDKANEFKIIFEQFASMIDDKKKKEAQERQARREGRG